MTHWYDGLYLAFLIAILPIWGWYDYQKFLRNAADSERDLLSLEYLKTIIMLVTMAVAVVLIWRSSGRAWSELGITPPVWSGMEWTGLMIAGGLSIGILTNIGMTIFAPKMAAKRVDAFNTLQAFLPRTHKQLRWGLATSVTAGICEEIVYRGFLIWVLSQHMPIYAAPTRRKSRIQLSEFRSTSCLEFVRQNFMIFTGDS